VVSNIELDLDTLRKKKIEIGDTALTRTITVKKMGLNAATNNFPKEERKAMRARFDMLDKEEEYVGQGGGGETGICARIFARVTSSHAIVCGCCCQ
jgi:hypothetical protein